MTPSGAAFDRVEAAHLLRRAAFAPTEAELDRAVAQGRAATIDGLFAAKAPPPSSFDDAIRSSSERADLAGALLMRLPASPAPLRETVALFFHNHFVSALSKVREGRMMLDQIELFRALGLGPFADLTKAVSRDPAMVRYLDLERSSRLEPNENFARELLELFTTGPGPYSERDIKEAARAFTGHHLRNGRFVFSAAAHDGGQKTVLGVRGGLGGDDVVDVVASHPATARFLARKLARAFVADEPSDQTVAGIAAALRANEGDVGRALRALFESEDFAFRSCGHAVTRAPAALVAAATKLLGAAVPPLDAARHAFAMGQALLDPPTVKGYPGGRRWLNPATLLARRTFLLESVRAARKSGSLPPAIAGAAEDPPRAFEALIGRPPSADEAEAVREAAAAAARDGAGVLEVIVCHPLFQRC
jgi:uncharacterized protein (DUF1800 family)